MFTHCDQFHHLFYNLKRKNIDESRYYEVGEATIYPSVTSVIGFINRAKFADWRAKVGEKEANRKTKHATRRGTDLHLVLENFIQNNNVKELDEYQKPLIQYMFNFVKPHLEEHMGTIYQQETPMFSNRLCLAGTVDLIAEWDGELAVLDFKTSEKEKPEEWLEDYFVQLSAYWAMFCEKTGLVPKKLVVILVGENGDVQIVQRRNIMTYLDRLKDYVSKFLEHRDA